MAYPGSDGKSDVDRPFLPERQGQAKQEPQKAAARGASGVGDSIKKHAPTMSHDMPGGGSVKAQYAGARLSKEAAAARKQQAIQKTAAKKMEKPDGIEQNKSKNRDNGRE